MSVPQAAIDAAAKALEEAVSTSQLGVSWDEAWRRNATAALEAAAPHIAAAERAKLLGVFGDKRFKTILQRPISGELLDAIAWADVLLVLHSNAQDAP